MKINVKKVLAVVLSFVFVLSVVPEIKPAIVANAATIAGGTRQKKRHIIGARIMLMPM